MSTAQMLMQQGMEKGMEKGMEQGMEKGMEQGMEQGLMRKAAEDARRMLNKGYSLEDVMDITGLTELEVHKIQKGEL